MTQGTRLSLVMPAYNEAAGIVEVVSEAHASLSQLGYPFEILVIDDGSSDTTATLVQEHAEQWPEVRLLKHAQNLGYGAALRTGFLAARYELVAFTDADGQFFLEELADLVDLTRRFPIVVGYRVQRQDPWQRRFLSWGYNRLVRTFLGTGVRDCDCALKVFRREMLLRLLPETSGFFVNTEMLAKAQQLGWKVGEIGVRHRPRRKGVSKVSLVEVPKTFATLMRYWWTNVLWAKALPRVSADTWAEPANAATVKEQVPTPV